MQYIRTMLISLALVSALFGVSTVMAESEEEACPCGADEDGECLPCPIEE